MAKQALIKELKKCAFLVVGTQDGAGRRDMGLINPVCFSIRKLTHKQSKYKGLFVPGNRAKYIVYL